mgnify:CR=1 FL=1
MLFFQTVHQTLEAVDRVAATTLVGWDLCLPLPLQLPALRPVPVVLLQRLDSLAATLQLPARTPALEWVVRFVVAYTGYMRSSMIGLLSLGLFVGEDDQENGDWSVVVLGVTVFVILCVCWYHRIAFPDDFTPFSSLLLVLFTAFFAFTIRGVFVRLLKLAYRCLRRLWGGNDTPAQSPRPDASAPVLQGNPN